MRLRVIEANRGPWGEYHGTPAFHTVVGVGPLSGILDGATDEVLRWFAGVQEGGRVSLRQQITRVNGSASRLYDIKQWLLEGPELPLQQEFLREVDQMRAEAREIVDYLYGVIDWFFGGDSGRESLDGLGLPPLAVPAALAGLAVGAGLFFAVVAFTNNTDARTQAIAAQWRGFNRCLEQGGGSDACLDMARQSQGSVDTAMREVTKAESWTVPVTLGALGILGVWYVFQGRKAP